MVRIVSLTKIYVKYTVLNLSGLDVYNLTQVQKDAFLLQEMEGQIMDNSRFAITTIVENGYPHYKIHDNLTGNEIHCDLNELNETIWQLLEVQEMVL